MRLNFTDSGSTDSLRHRGLVPGFLACLGLLAPSLGHARSEGITGANSQTVHCGQCHNSTGQWDEQAAADVAPDVSLVATRPIALEQDNEIELVVRSQGPLPRAFGLNLAVSWAAVGTPTAGTLVVGRDAPVRLQGPELTHNAPIDFDADGEARVGFALRATNPGTNAIYVAVNDVNLDGEEGPDDRVVARVFCYDVGEPTETGLECTDALTVQPGAPEVAESEDGAPLQAECVQIAEPAPAESDLAPASGAVSAAGGCAAGSPAGSAGWGLLALFAAGFLATARFTHRRRWRL